MTNRYRANTLTREVKDSSTPSGSASIPLVYRSDPISGSTGTVQESAGEQDRQAPEDTLLNMRPDSAPQDNDFDHIVQGHYRRIFRFLLASSRDLDLAETLTQECFLSAYRAWPKFRGDASVSTWLTSIAINLQRSHWRSRRLRFWHQIQTNSVDVDEVRDWLPDKDVSPESRVLLNEQLEAVWRAVGELKEKQRIVFILFVVERMTIPEITEATGLLKGTAKTHLWRAMTNVRNRLQAEVNRLEAP